MTFSPSYLMKNRYGIFYFQYRIPSNFLKIANGRKLIRISLRTRVRRDALKQARKWSILMDELALRFFNSSESFGKGMELLMEYQRLAKESPDWEVMEDFLMRLDEGEDAVLNMAIKYREASVGNSEKLIQEIGLLKKTIEILNSKASHDPQENSLLPVLSNQFKSLQISELVRSYLNDCRSRWDPKHYGSNERDIAPKLALFVEIVGDKPANEITKEDISRYKAVLQNYPKNKNKIRAYKDLTIDEIVRLQIPTKDKLSRTSIHNHSTKIKSFIDWCGDNITGLEKELKSPLKKLPQKTVSADEERDAFSDDDLKKLFESKEYMQGLHRQAAHYWVPLLGLFTGARANEICQLYKSDIYQDSESKQWVISFNGEAEDKKQKKSSHKRIVPIHKKLIDIGFIDFVNSIPTERLFNELPRRRDGYADSFSKWFNRTYRSSKHCNVGQVVGEKKNFHSFRHTFITKLHNTHNVDQASIARLVGQKPNDSSVTINVYTKKRSIEENYKIINKLDFPIDFKKIRKWRNNSRKF